MARAKRRYIPGHVWIPSTRIRISRLKRGIWGLLNSIRLPTCSMPPGCRPSRLRCVNAQPAYPWASSSLPDSGKNRCCCGLPQPLKKPSPGKTGCLRFMSAASLWTIFVNYRFDKQKKLDNPRERNISNRKYLTPFCSDSLIDSDIVGSLSNQKRRCCGFTSGLLPEHGPAFRQ